MRHNVGKAPVIVMGARLRVSDDFADAMQDLEETLLGRIETLLSMQGNGLLRASVVGSTTKRPRFKLESEIQAEQVLRRKVLGMDFEVPADASSPLPPPRRPSLIEAALEQEFRDSADEFRLEDALPLWSVSLYEVPSDRTAAVLALSVHHVVADGKGSQAILNALLFGHGLANDAVDAPRSIASTEKASKGKKSRSSSASPIPPSSNETLPMAPPFLSLVLPLALAKYVMPSLAPVIPPPIRRTYNRKPAWPALRAKPDGKPSRREPVLGWLGEAPPVEMRGPELRVVRYDDVRLVDALKAAGKANGVATIHATLHTAMILALGVALFPKMAPAGPASAAVGTKVEAAFKDYVYASETPVDHRTASLGHGTFTGNFIGAAWWRAVVSGRSSFWSLARDYAGVISDERKRREALWSTGLLKYLKASPEGKGVQPGTTREMNGSRPATGWERWWNEKSTGRRPHRVSAGLSNLGLSRIEGNVVASSARSAGTGSAGQVQVEEVAMTQCPSAIGPAIDVDVMGYKGAGDRGGLNLSVSWRRGVLDDEVTTGFVEALEIIVPLIAEGHFGRDKTMVEGVGLVRSKMGGAGVGRSRAMSVGGAARGGRIECGTTTWRARKVA